MIKMHLIFLTLTGVEHGKLEGLMTLLEVFGYQEIMIYMHIGMIGMTTEDLLLLILEN